MSSRAPKLEIDPILAVMEQGVVVLDPSRAVVKMNPAAMALLDLSAHAVEGVPIEKLTDNPQLLSFIDRAFAAKGALDDGLDVGATKRAIHAYARHLPGDGSSFLLIVLSDSTRLRRLENIRRDFVANVSHELKTPVTSIKGFVETLLDGALNNRADAERFLHIISRQADRLSFIFEDLLTLAKLEQHEDSLEITFVDTPIIEVVSAAVLNAEHESRARNVIIEVICPASIVGAVNPRLLEQAVGNLVENAVKYGGAVAPIHVEVSQLGGELTISVTDRGSGIAPEHLPRLFERFYRIDTARSRKEGGTGLGLSIVKHIAQVHGGHATVTSTVGEGSTFSIRIPVRRARSAV